MPLTCTSAFLFNPRIRGCPWLTAPCNCTHPWSLSEDGSGKHSSQLQAIGPLADSCSAHCPPLFLILGHLLISNTNSWWLLLKPIFSQPNDFIIEKQQARWTFDLQTPCQENSFPLLYFTVMDSNKNDACYYLVFGITLPPSCIPVPSFTWAQLTKISQKIYMKWLM